MLINVFLKEKFQDLISTIFSRLPEHIARKVDDKVQSTCSWVWGFVKKNLSAVCVLMVLVKHTKGSELLKFCHGMDPCLLDCSSEQNNFIPGEDAKDLEGCYLYWDTIGKKFIRSGKVTGGKKGTQKGRTFEVRNKEHEKGAKLKTFQDRQSQFYTKYPSSENSTGNLNILGHFENLTQYCGFASSHYRNL